MQSFTLDNVTFLDTFYANAFVLMGDYLKSLEPDKLLSGFYTSKGLIPKDTPYGGWEGCAIAGHTMGHYLTALAQSYGQTRDHSYRVILDYLLDGLASAQHDNGYIGAIPEHDYDKLEAGDTAGTWVPWYIMHKTISGLIGVYQHTENRKALDLASRLGDWTAARTGKWSQAVQEKVLSVEYGGMNDCLYDLYALTGKREHLDAAHAFDELSLFTPLSQGKDILEGKHANTTIPKFIGALKRYKTLGEGQELYLRAAVRFWEIVTEHHSYVTGGNSEWEHFGKPDSLDARRTEYNCETCNSYNMLKLTRELFLLTGDLRYAHYYERTHINSILSSQNPETGMTTYFQPMATGFFKTYGSRYEHFWCCTGTGMESFTKLGDSIYFHDDENVYINLFVSSELVWREKNLWLVQTADFKNHDTLCFAIGTDNGESEAGLRIRIPDWIAGAPCLRINGILQECVVENGYLVIDQGLGNGTVIDLTFPMELQAHPLPDNPDTVAFSYGPYVLSAGLGREDMRTGSTGINVTVPTRTMPLNDQITVLYGTRDEWLASVSKNAHREATGFAFTLLGTDANLVFIPHYLRYQERYGIYWRITDKASADSEKTRAAILEKKEKDRLLRRTVDALPVGNDHYELKHRMQSALSSKGDYKLHRYRDARPGGWFQYELSVLPDSRNNLLVAYCSEDAGRSFNIYVNNSLLAEETLQNTKPRSFYTKCYPLPLDITGGQERVTIRFEARGSSYAGGVFDTLRIVGDYGADPSLLCLEIDGEALVLSPETSDYTVTLDHEAETVSYRATLREECGLLYENGVLVDDTQAHTLTLDGPETLLVLTTKAEDHKTQQSYTLRFRKSEAPYPPEEPAEDEDVFEPYIIDINTAKKVPSVQDTRNAARTVPYALVLGALAALAGGLALILHRHCKGKQDL